MTTPALREYHVVINGMPTTAMLDDADAKRLNAVLVATKPAPAPPIKTTAAAAPPNMARDTGDKPRRR